MAYKFVVGYTPIGASTWDTGQNSGTINSTFFPGSDSPQTTLPALPANFKLTEMWTYLNIGSGRNTTIPIGVIDINGGTANTKPLLYSENMTMSDSGGTGWRWIGITGLNVNFSEHAGKRLAAASGRPADGALVQFRYEVVSGTPFGGWSITNRGVDYSLPNPFPSGQAAEYVSLYAIFEPINPYIEVGQSSVQGRQLTLSSDTVGKPVTVVPF
jgi:hypothetical protein